MKNKLEKGKEEAQVQKTIRTALRIGFVALLFIMSFQILRPFLVLILWGVIIAVALFPLQEWLAKKLGNRRKLSAVIIVLMGLSFLVFPSIVFTSSTIDTVQAISADFSDGTLSIPPPDEDVLDWPLVGSWVYETWLLASESLSDLLDEFEPQIKEAAPKILSAITGLGLSILMFIAALIIAGALMAGSNSGEKAARAVFNLLAGKAEGERFTLLAAHTIRGVVQGVLGTAIIQTLMISIAMFIIGVPGAGLLSLLVLIIAVVQLPLILVMIPISIFVFTMANTTPAILFTIWVLIWGASDNVIKPILMGRGVEVPMLVILLGAIGGMIWGGIIGLFVGAVFLSLAYTIFQAISKAE